MNGFLEYYFHMKENNNGFTLAELLIVVAIIGILVAISIPIFTSQLERSKEATDIANIRAAKSEAIATAIDIEVGGTAATEYNGLIRKKDGGGLFYYEGYYNIGTGKFQSDFVGAGRGTKKDGGAEYPAYRSSFDYSKTGQYGQCGIFVAIFPQPTFSYKRAIYIGWRSPNCYGGGRFITSENGCPEAGLEYYEY